MPDENCSTHLGEGKQLPKDGLGVQFESIAACRVGTWQSSATGSSPTATKLSELITRSMHMTTDAKSLNRGQIPWRTLSIEVGPGLQPLLGECQ